MRSPKTSSQPQGLSVVIPCLNEERTISSSVRQAMNAIAKCGVPGEVLVVDNGSTDQSFERALAEGARVIRCAQRGYGATLRCGFLSAQFDVIAMIDADLSYPFAALPDLWRELGQGADFVLGNRLRGPVEPGAMPFLNRYLGTPVLSWLLRRLHGIPTHDCNSGMRLFYRDHVMQLQLESPGMELASEMLIAVARRKLNYREVTIPFHRDLRGRSSHLNRWRDGLRHLALILGARVANE
jgi:glycosyltransferase involved in cell wall biosynthesis